jgi:hypothetical protein
MLTVQCEYVTKFSGKSGKARKGWCIPKKRKLLHDGGRQLRHRHRPRATRGLPRWLALPVLAFFQSLTIIMRTLMNWLHCLAPIGICFLVMSKVAGERDLVMQLPVLYTALQFKKELNADFRYRSMINVLSERCYRRL